MICHVKKKKLIFLQNQSILICVILIFLSINSFAASLTNQITEPNQPVETGTTFVLTNRAGIDQNVVIGSEGLIEQGSFENLSGNGDFLGWAPNAELHDGYTGGGGFGADCWNSGVIRTRFISQSTIGATDGTYSRRVIPQLPLVGLTAGFIICVANHTKTADVISFVSGTNRVVLNSSSFGQFLDVNINNYEIKDQKHLAIGIGCKEAGGFVDWLCGYGGHSMFHTGAIPAGRYNLLMDVNVTSPITNQFHSQIDNIRLQSVRTIYSYPQADCNSSFNNSAFSAMTWNSDTNKYTSNFTAPNFSGDYNYAISCSKVADSNSSNTLRDYDEGLITVLQPLDERLEITNINNTDFSIDINSVNLTFQNYNPSTNPSFEFKARSLDNLSFVVAYEAYQAGFDFDEDEPRIFYIYTRPVVTQEIDLNNYEFNETLTFAQKKIWDSVNERYIHTISRTINPAEIQYFKFDYKKPLIAFKSFSDETAQEFFAVTTPFAKTRLDGRDVDIFNLSAFNSLFIDSKLENGFPIPQNDIYESRYNIMFTAWADQNVNITIDGTTRTISTTPTTYQFNVDGDFNISSTLPSTLIKLYIEAFSLSERAFFADTLKAVQEDYRPLNVILDGNNARQVIEEGQNFRVLTSLYEKGIEENQDLNAYRVQVFLNTYGDANKVFEKLVEIDEEDFLNEITIDVDELVEGIITTTGNVPLLAPLRIQVEACGLHLIINAGEPTCYAVQEIQDIVLRQFPYSNSQLLIQLITQDFFVGEKPSGTVYLETDFDEAIEYVVLSIYEQGESATSSDWNQTFFKGQDFECFADFCQFDFEAEDWVFEKAVDYYIQVTVKVTTEELDFDNDLLNKTFFLEAFQIGFKQKYLNLYNQSRSARIFLDYEKIPLVLNIQDNLNLPSRDDLNVFIQIWGLGTGDFNSGGDAKVTFQATKWNWDYYYYDVNKGINRYAWAQRLHEISGAFENLHFYRLFVRIQDESKKRETIIPITLSNTANSTGGYTSDTNAFQNANEVSIKIDNGVSLDAPVLDQNGLDSLICVDGQTSAADKLLGVDSASKAAGIVGVIAGFATVNPVIFNFGLGLIFSSSVTSTLDNKACTVQWVDKAHYVDNIRVYVYNDYSDLTEQDEKYKQYMNFTIPESTLIFNEGLVSFNEYVKIAPSNCQTTYGANTFGLFVCVANSFLSGQFSELIINGRNAADFLTKGRDINAVLTINPQTKFVQFEVSNLVPINVIDFETAGISLEDIPNQKIMKYLFQDKEMKIQNDVNARVKVFQNNVEILNFKIPNRLIDRIAFEEYSDINGIKYSTVQYKMRVDLCYNSGRNCLEPRVLQFTDNIGVKESEVPLLTALPLCFASTQNFGKCFIGFFSTAEILITTILIIMIVFLVVFFIAMRNSATRKVISGTVSGIGGFGRAITRRKKR